MKAYTYDEPCKVCGKDSHLLTVIHTIDGPDRSVWFCKDCITNKPTKELVKFLE